MRADVLGEARVDASKRTDALLDPFHELAFEFAWGSIWARGGIPVKTRRFLAIALLAAQNRSRELAMHMRAALAHDCTAEELREVCMQLTLYCGFPAAADALRTLAEIVAESAGAKPAPASTRKIRAR